MFSLSFIVPLQPVFAQSEYHLIADLSGLNGFIEFSNAGIVRVFAGVSAWWDDSTGERVSGFKDWNREPYIVQNLLWRDGGFKLGDRYFSDGPDIRDGIFHKDSVISTSPNGLGDFENKIELESNEFDVLKVIAVNRKIKKYTTFDLDADGRNELIVVSSDSAVPPQFIFRYEISLDIFENSEPDGEMRLLYSYSTDGDEYKNDWIHYFDMEILDVNLDGHPEILLYYGSAGGNQYTPGVLLFGNFNHQKVFRYWNSGGVEAKVNRTIEVFEESPWED